MTQSDSFPNRLITESSPYLRQHALNPVDWYAWGPEALAKAKAEDKPILLSIGYSACHWCHVMSHECFENRDIAAVLNTHFVSVKVDREERPDLDDIYQKAAQVFLGRGGGWPLTMFLTPDGEPFWGGTYFPPSARYGRPGFIDVLKSDDALTIEIQGHTDNTGTKAANQTLSQQRAAAVRDYLIKTGGIAAARHVGRLVVPDLCGASLIFEQA